MKLTEKEFKDKVYEKALNKGITLNEDKLNKLYLYKEMLLEWNEKINLTAITDDEEIIEKHIIDCLYGAKYIKEGMNIIDVGTGAGLPGVILAIYFEGSVNITLFDALNKRVIFLNEVIEKLNLKNTLAVHGRAEEVSKIKDYRETYDIVISRAVATLNVLLEITVPFVKVNGLCIYMKADKTKDEIDKSKNAMENLKVKLNKIEEYVLKVNDEDIRHTLIILDKIKTCPEKYPRQFAKIKKNPL